MTRHLRTFLLAVLTLAGIRLVAATPPNILFILADDMGAHDTVALGSDFYETPNLDRLRREGMSFSSAYANAANCAPSRACIMSGQYTPRHGIFTVGSSERGEASQRKLIPTPNNETLARSFVTFPEVLKAAGYANFFGGKWHLGEGDTGPLGQGFDVNVGGGRSGDPRGTYFAPWNIPDLPPAPAGTHVGDYVTEQAISWLRARPKDRPFFSCVWYYDVHTPLQAKAELLRKYQAKLADNERRGVQTLHHRPVYAAMMETMDTNIGRLLATLDELGFAENTIVVFSSDNGGYGGATSMKPLRGCKGMLYEGGIRVPLLVRWPGHVRPGSSCSEPVLLFDLYPTFAELAGTRAPAGTTPDGVSLLPLLRDPAARLGRDALFWHSPIYLSQVPKPFLADAPFGTTVWRGTPSSAVRRGDWKLIEYFEEGQLELFNLRDDPGEQHNLAEREPARARELRGVLQRWREATHAPVPTQLNPAYVKTE